MWRIFSSITNFFNRIKKLFSEETDKIDKDTIYDGEEGVVEEIHSLWDYLKFKENTQAFHISGVMGFEEWISMEEIMRRIRELFGVEYRNCRSLYPYLKTLVDCGLFECLDVGGTRKWRKKDLIIKIKEEKKVEEKGTLEEKVVKKKESKQN